MEATTTSFNKWYYYLNRKLVKEEKPCLPDDYIHIHKWEGCFRVYDVNTYYFTILRQRTYVQLPWDEFRCKKGAGIISELLDIRYNMNLNYHRLSVLISKLRY